MKGNSTPITDEAEDRCRNCGLTFVLAEDSRTIERNCRRLVEVLRELHEAQRSYATICDTSTGERLEAAALRAIDADFAASAILRELGGGSVNPEYTAEPIITEYIHPPIPLRCYDWRASRKDYDGAPDSNDPLGYGRTEQEAIADLLEKEAT